MSKQMNVRALELFKKMIPIIGLFLFYFILLREAAVQGTVGEVRLSQKIAWKLTDFVASFDFSNPFAVAKTAVSILVIWGIYEYWLTDLTLTARNREIIKRIAITLVLLNVVRHIKPDAPLGGLFDGLVMLGVAYLIYGVTWIAARE